MTLRRQLAFLGLILAVGLALRLAYLSERREAPDFDQPIADAAFHDYWARGLATGDWTPPAGEDDPRIPEVPYLRPPGYPYVLGFAYRLAGDGPLTARALQIVLGLLNVGLVFLLGRTLFRPAVGLVAAAFAALHWSGIYFEGELQAVTLTQTLLLASLLVLQAAPRRSSPGLAVFGGILLGLLALVRANALLFLPVAAVWLFLVDRRRPLRAALLLVSGVVAVAPAGLRNLRVADDFFPVSANGAVNLWIGNHPGADGVSAKIPSLGRLTGREGWSWFSYGDIVAGVSEEAGRPLKYSEVSARFSALARDWIRANPGEFVSLCAKRALLFWGPDEISNNKAIRFEKSSSRVLGPSPGFALPFALALAGAFVLAADSRVRRRRSRGAPVDVVPPGVVLAGLFALTWFLSFVPFLAAARFRAPLMPVLFVLGAVALVRFVGALSTREWKGAAVLAAGVLALLFLTTRSTYESPVDEAWWHTDRGLAHRRAGRTDEAIAELRAAVTANPGFIDAHLALAEIYEEQDRTADALEHYLAVVQRRPDRTTIMMKTGVLLIEEKRFRLAAEYLGTVVQISDAAEPHFEYGRALTELGRYEEGIAQFQESLELQPEQPAAYANLGIALQRAGRTAEAIDAFRESIYLDPYGKEALFELGNTLHEAGELEEAKEAFDQASRVSPLWVEPRVHRGNVHNELGEYAEAITWYEDAIRIDPKHVVARYNISGSLANLGRFEEALMHLELAREADPGNQLVQQRIAQIRALLPQDGG